MSRSKLWRCLPLLCAAASCGRYGDFRLPAAAGQLQPVTWRWEQLGQPVLRHGGAGDFDGVDALNPSIVQVGVAYWNLYSGWDGKRWRTGLATSADGLRWEKQGPVLAPEGWEGTYIAANGALLHRQSQFFYWYQAGTPPHLALATSTDGRLWRKHPQAVLEPGPRGAWDELGVADPYVIEAQGLLYLYYLGQDRARRQRLGVAVSADGLHWQRSLANPILELGEPGEFDAVGLGEPAVWAQHGQYWMLYTGRDDREWRRIGLAASADGIHWRRQSPKPVIDVQPGWNARVVCDPEVRVQPDGMVRVWFGGGDRAEPAENLHGQIGAGRLLAVAVKP